MLDCDVGRSDVRGAVVGYRVIKFRFIVQLIVQLIEVL